MLQREAEMNNNDIAWISGFYEGEGSIGCYRDRIRENGKEEWSLTLSITQKEPDILEYIKNKIGFGKIHKSGEVHRFYCHFKEAKDFIEMIRPFMKCDKKMKQANKALEIASQKIHCGSLNNMPTNHKLSKEKIGRIKGLYPSLTQKTIAEMFGVTQGNISRILNNLRWNKYVTATN